MFMLFPLLIVGGPSVLWLLLGQIAPVYTPPAGLANKKVTLVVAHPDDEAMFFGPTLSTILNPANNNTVQIVSLTNGDAEGLGDVRTSEFKHSCELLGASEDTEIKVVNVPELPDTMAEEWDPKVVGDAFEEHVDGDVVITFDDQGISEHINHKSCFKGAIRWKATNPAERSVWVLNSVPVWRKYTCTIDAVYTKLMDEYFPQEKPVADKHTVIISHQVQTERNRGAMIKAHKSQMVWYRWFYVQFSRYMVVNDLQEL